VNSTSKEAWKAVLASSNGLPYDPVDGTGGPDLGVAFSRLLSPMSGGAVRDDSWLNYRILQAEELEDLAVEIVAQIRERGPFLSLADFVNRRLGGTIPGDGLQGALAQAIDDANSNVNGNGQLELVGENVTSANINATARDWYIEEAIYGLRSAGATRWLLQGDLLSRIGGMIATRSDTFLIRTYGAAPDGGEAFLEAVVQRIPEAVEPTGGDPFAVSGNFGRKFRILSLRWMAAEDV